jgi:hypothetical protein
MVGARLTGLGAGANSSCAVRCVTILFFEIRAFVAVALERGEPPGALEASDV